MENTAKKDLQMIDIKYPGDKATQIQVADGLLDESVCKMFIERMKDHWHHSFQGETFGGVDPKTKLTEDLHYSRERDLNWTEKDSWLEEQVCSALTSAIAIYKQNYRHLDVWTDIRDSGFQVQRYLHKFGYYRPHVDSFPMPYSAISERVLAAVIYLNDVEYGGQTNFPLHEVSVQPKAGRICLFPATFTHPHESCVPITGDKWIISSFITNEQSHHPHQLPTEEHHPHGDHHTHEDHHSVE